MRYKSAILTDVAGRGQKKAGVNSGMNLIKMKCEGIEVLKKASGF
jgi:hypothetical protein